MKLENLEGWDKKKKTLKDGLWNKKGFLDNKIEGKVFLTLIKWK